MKVDEARTLKPGQRIRVRIDDIEYRTVVIGPLSLRTHAIEGKTGRNGRTRFIWVSTQNGLARSNDIIETL